MSQINQKQFERIEAYLDGLMDAEERLAFEVKMKGDAVLAKEVSVQGTLRHSVEAGAFGDELDKLHGELFENKETAHSQSAVSLWKIAAGVAVIITLGALMFNNESKKEKLFAEYQTQDPGLPVSMSSTDTYEFYDAMVNYKEEKFELAISKWKHLQLSDPHNDTLSYFIASAHFNKGNYESAVSNYLTVLKDGNGQLEQKSMWYLALSYLKTGQIQEILRMTPSDDSDYKNRIQELQEQLSE